MSARKPSKSQRSVKQATSSHRETIRTARTKGPSHKNVNSDQATPPVGGDRTQRKGRARNIESKSQVHGARRGTKLATIIAQLKQKGGTTIKALSETTGWQKHSVHGVISGTLRTKTGINVQTEVKDGVHYYRIAE